jgi:integral membrane sensor domain MASE1
MKASVLSRSSVRRPSRSDLLAWVGRVLLLAAVYVVTGILRMQLAHYREGVTLIWAPTGLSLAALILFGRQLWPGVFIGTLLNATDGYR